MTTAALTRRSLLAGCAAAGLAPAAEARAPMAAGAGSFMFTRWPGPEILVHTFAPESAVGGACPLLFVMHGQGRNASEYRDNWIEIAARRRVTIVAPEFDQRRFPRTAGYALGGLSEPEDETRFHPTPASPINVIEPLFDDICARLNSPARSYALFGHSAGGQFAHRFTMFGRPERASCIIAANAGWYTFASTAIAFPYGLADAAVDTRQIREMFARPLTILLGRDDTDTQHQSLRRTPEADAQGPHRLARGEHFFAAARNQAMRMGAPFAWRLAFAPGVAHDNGAIAPFAADLLFGAETERGL
jgi:poly(3-hydroxybutyrate) depolymerase